ncbi:hypothetical protein PIB30_023857 [Stylosanthes scabra]|uniref:BZIP domain-containing protein n=1 Tax=Stylosanthes scabra TaxID=79078 RepID=A0ABU6R9T6_9FABA|nr:hypothetical protein [Stylosanthes scabra]
MNNNHHHHLQQPNLGDATAFEEILARAEMINHNSSNNDYNIANQDNVLVDTKPLIGVADPMVMASHHQPNWLQMQFPSMQQHHHQENLLCQDIFDSKPVVENPMMETDYSNSSLGISMPVAATTSSTCSDSKEVAGAGGGPGRRGQKRGFSNELQEQNIDRRQKRMAKNRESAAKSRAKKQAYIEKLENDKSRLLKSNRWLKKVMEFEERLFSDTTLTPRYQLRRTSSNTF